jgi:pyruvate dehydrogenase E1 component beta subunit
MGLLEVRTALRDAMAEEMERDKNVILLGEEVGHYNGAYKVSVGLLDKFGSERVIDTPISEHGFAGLGVGMAFGGLRPIVEFMTFNFAMQAIDQIVNSAAKTQYMSGGMLKCPIVFRGPNGAAARVGAQHSQCFASWYSHIPGIKVISPYYSDDCKGLLKAAIRDDNPVIFLEHELAYGHKHEVNDDVCDDNYLVSESARITKSGTDISLISFSLRIKYTLEAAKILHNEGINAEVIDLRVLKPLDLNTIIDSIKKTNNAVIIEEGWAYSGIGSEIVSLIIEHAFEYLDSPILRVTAKDIPLPYAENLEYMALPQVEDIVYTVKQVLNRKL